MSTSDPADRRRELQEERHAWEALQSSPTWLKLVVVLQAQADMLQTQVVFQPLARMDEALAQEWHKGKLCGLLQVSKTVEGLLADIEMELEELTGE